MTLASRRDCLKILAAGGSLLTMGASVSNRQPTIDDYLAMEDVGLVQASPDGRWIAVERGRPRSMRAQRAEDRGLETRSDIWVVDTTTSTPRRLTRGRENGWGYWNPLWSPDGNWIAVLTTEGGRGVRLGIVDRSTGRVKVIGGRNVAEEVNFGSPSPYSPFGRVWGVWTGNTTFLTALLPSGEANLEEGTADPLGQYGPLWAATQAGELSATVWDSRQPVICGAATTLVEADLASGASLRALMTGPIRSVSLSRGKQRAAVIMATGPRPTSPTEPIDQDLAYNGYSLDALVQTALAVVDLSAGRLLGTALGVGDLGFAHVRRHPQWGVGDQSLFVPSYSAKKPDRVFKVSIPSLEVESFSARSPLDAEFLAALLARFETLEASSQLLDERYDLTAQKVVDNWNRSVPGTVFTFDGVDLALVVDGRVMRVDGRGRVLESLDLQGAGPLLVRDPARPTVRAVFSHADAVFTIDAESGGLRRTPLGKPEDEARFVTLLPSQEGCVWINNPVRPTRLWLSGQQGRPPRGIMEVNRFLETLEPAKVISFRYRGIDDAPGLAAILLPEGYDQARQYPVVIHGYPTTVLSESSVASHGLFGVPGRIHQALLCAAGYVVVVPSLPMPPGATRFDPLELVAQQVEHVAEELIARGFASKGRIGFMGHSYGGYAALAVAARTHQINAVVASSPFADLITYHDIPFTWYERDACAPSRSRFHATELESPNAALLRMGGSPDMSLQRYLANSPRYQIGPTSPPVLMLDGQFDGAGFRNVDAMFMALSRYGVPTKVLRYWGEGHNLGGPGNIRSAWAETLAWFDEYLKRIP